MGELVTLTRRKRDELFRDTREALKFAQRAFNEARYADAALWADKAEAKANTLRITAERKRDEHRYGATS